MKRFLSLLGCLTLLLTAVCPVSALASAEPAAETNTVYIDSVNDMLALAENCVQDTYSQDLAVYLRADIKLNDADFSGIPYFAGTFYGNNHTISGLSLTGDGSRQGLFRTAAETAVIQDLKVSGTVTAGGSACMIGGLVGDNSGTLVNCSFEGTVSGSEQIGGLVGVNNASGSMTMCSFSGNVTGSHKVGGLCGDNSGLLLSCTNNGSVNTDYTKPDTTLTFDISALDLSSLTSDSTPDTEPEEIIDISDLGGIAGYNCGIVRGCTNSGDVGYARVGYNIGGIVGRGTGLVHDCTNNGSVLGRKDIGGITGQLEPQSEWDFSESKLEELNNAVSSLGDSVDAAAENMDSNISSTVSQLSNVAYYLNLAGNDLSSVLGGSMDSINDAADRLTQVVDLIRQVLSGEDVQNILAKLETIRAAIDTIEYSGNISYDYSLEYDESDGASGEISVSADIDSQISELLGLIDELINTEKQSIDSSSIAQMVDLLSGIYVSIPDFSTFFNDFSQVISAAAGLKSSITGLSSQTTSDIESIVDDINTVYVTFFSTAEEVADLETDMEVDVSDLRSDDLTGGAAVECENQGSVSGDTNVGGIAGNISWEISFDMEDELNLSDYLLTNAKKLISAVISGCSSYGNITAREEYAGGIAGNMAFGSIRGCTGGGTVSITDGDYCGGIAGRSAGRISDCRTRSILSGGAYVGGIAGQGGTITDCLAYSNIESADEYVGAVAGALDGEMSGCRYIDCGFGAVDGVTYADEAREISYEELSSDDNIPDSLKDVIVTFEVDGAVYQIISVPYGGSIAELPQVPDNGTQYWKWDDFDAGCIRYSCTVSGAWFDPVTTLSSGEEPAKILVEGTFYEYHTLTVGEFMPEAAGMDTKDANILAAYKLSVNNDEPTLTVRLRMPDSGTLYLLGDDGTCEELDYTRDGTYICFTMPNGGRIVFTDSNPASVRWMLYVFPAAGAVLIAGAVVTFVLVRKKKHKKPAAQV